MAALLPPIMADVPVAEPRARTDPQWLETWRRFAKHRMAFASLMLLAFLYVACFLGEALISAPVYREHYDRAYDPPAPIYIVEDGRLVGPYTYELNKVLDRRTYDWTYTVDAARKVPLGLFVRGDRYLLLGVFDTDIHLLGRSDGQPLNLMGTDQFGRDILARILVGGRLSLTIPVLAVLVSVMLGTLLGAISGYVGGSVDVLIQRFIEVLSGFPRLALWMALAAVIPRGMGGAATYALMATVLAAVGWGQLARQIRGRTLQLRSTQYVLAARAMGASSLRIIVRHLVPNSTSVIIVFASVAIPEYLLVESALSFLGIGLTPPLVSWGVLLKEAQTIRVIVQYPWELFPGLIMVLAMISFNFVGDGIRDALETRRL